MPKHAPARSHAPQSTWRRAAAAAVLATPALLGSHSAWADAYDDVQQRYQAGHTQQALQDADAYIRQHPNDPQMRFVKANLLTQEGKPDAAEAELVALTQTYPELAEPWNNLAVLYASKGDLEGAVQALESALRIDPTYATAQENMGDVRVQLAQQAYEQSRKSGNDSPRLQHKLQVLGELQQAVPDQDAD